MDARDGFLKMALEELKLMGDKFDELDQEMASLLSVHQDVVQRLAEAVGSSISIGETAGFMGGPLLWRGRKCRDQLQPAFAKRQQVVLLSSWY